MTIIKTKEGTKLTAAVAGRIDTTTAPETEKELSESLDGITELCLDFKDLEYISSAGLRVLVVLKKRMNDKGTMYITGVNDVVRGVFEVTGFDSIVEFS